jgi:hypothetical protein
MEPQGDIKIMTSSKLPSPIYIDLSKDEEFKAIIDYVYQSYFKDEFMNKEKRERLFDKFIFLDLNFIYYKPERFWHIISFEPNDEKYTVNPCVNANDLLICNKNKSNCYDCICIPMHQKLKNRCECIYRLRRINWINPILKLANEKDECIKVWFEDDKDENNIPLRKTYIRFEEGLADYLIVLCDFNMNGMAVYKFVTAYPVVHNGTKRRLNLSFKKFKNK